MIKMQYRIKNLTFSTLRLLIDGVDIRLTPRKNTFLKSISLELIAMEKKGFVKIKQVK